MAKCQTYWIFLRLQKDAFGLIKFLREKKMNSMRIIMEEIVIILSKR